jgi:hypothetical protein
MNRVTAGIAAAIGLASLASGPAEAQRGSRMISAGGHAGPGMDSAAAAHVLSEADAGSGACPDGHAEEGGRKSPADVHGRTHFGRAEPAPVARRHAQARRCRFAASGFPLDATELALTRRGRGKDRFRPRDCCTPWRAAATPMPTRSAKGCSIARTGTRGATGAPAASGSSWAASPAMCAPPARHDAARRGRQDEASKGCAAVIPST